MNASQALAAAPRRSALRHAGVTAVLRRVANDWMDVLDWNAPEDQPVIRPAAGPREMNEVYRLTHDAYLERGYIQPQPDGRLIHYPEFDDIPATTVLVATIGGAIVGTNSLTVDGPRGLTVEKDFPDACRAMRREGRRLACGWRLCTRSAFRAQRQIVLGLMRATIRLGVEHGIRTCLFTFNPRHESIYRRLLNMRTVAQQEESVQGLKNAPGVLMRLDAENLPAWCLQGGRPTRRRPVRPEPPIVLSHNPINEFESVAVP